MTLGRSRSSNNEPSPRRSAGFTLIELMVVLAIITIMIAVAVPTIVTAIANSKLRGAASSLSGLMQSSRMQAVKLNRTITVRFLHRDGVPFAFAKRVDDTSSNTVNTAYEVQLGAATFDVVTPGAGTPAISSTVLSFTPLNYPELVSFNERGLPCKYTAATGACATAGFVYYINDTAQPNAWTAVSVSPGGRVKQWFWNGTVWSD